MDHSAAFEDLYREHGRQETLGGRTLRVVQHPDWIILEKGGRYELLWLEGRAILSRFGGTLDHRLLRSYIESISRLLKEFPGSEWWVESVPPLATGLRAHQVALSGGWEMIQLAPCVKVIPGERHLALTTRGFLAVLPAHLQSKLRVFSTLEEALADWDSETVLAQPPEISDLDRAVGRLLALLPSEQPPAEVALEEVSPEYALLFETIKLVDERVNELLSRQEQLLSVQHLALEVTQSAIWTWDLDSDEVSWSEEMRAMFEAGPEECFPEAAFARLSEQDSKQMRRSLAIARETGVFPSVIEHLHLPSGTPRVIQVSGKVLEQGGQRLLIGVSQDITKAVGYRTRSRLMQVVTNHLSEFKVGVMVRDLLTDEIVANGAFLEHFSQVVSREAFLKLIHPNAREAYLAKLQELDGHGTGFELLAQFWANERWTWVETLVRQVEVGAGRYNITLVRIVDEQVRIQEHYGRTEQDLNLWIIGKQLTHELATPLAAMRGTLDLLWLKRERYQVPEKALQRGLIGAEEVARIMNSLRDLMERTLDQRPSELNFNEISERMRSFLPGIGFLQGHPVELTYDAALPWVQGRELQLLQALLVLIRNGAEALKEQPKAPALQVRFRAAPDELWLEVEDAGPGVDAQHRGLIYERGFSTKASSSGYGLSLVTQITAEHQGVLELITQTPEHPGALFRIRIPAFVPPEGATGPSPGESDPEHGTP